MGNGHNEFEGWANCDDFGGGHVSGERQLHKQSGCESGPSSKGSVPGKCVHKRDAERPRVSTGINRGNTKRFQGYIAISILAGILTQISVPFAQDAPPPTVVLKELKELKRQFREIRMLLKNKEVRKDAHRPPVPKRVEAAI